MPTDPGLVKALRAIDRGVLAPMLSPDHRSQLAGATALVLAGAALSREQERGAIRTLHAASDVLAGPLSMMGVELPALPEPVAAAPNPRADDDTARPKCIVGADGRILVETPFELREIMKALPGVSLAPIAMRNAGVRAGTDKAGKAIRIYPVWIMPGSPASAATLLHALAPFNPRKARSVRELAQQHRDRRAARALLADGAELPDDRDGTDEVTMPLWTHQRRAVAYGEAASAVLFAIKMGGGKALRLDTPIPTPSGWTPMGDLRAGDEVFDERGEVCRVVEAHPVLHGRPCREVEFSDGSVIVADADHLWFTETRADRAGQSFARWYGSEPRPGGAVRTTDEIGATLRVGKRSLTNHSVPVAGALRLSDVALPVAPYVLGAWLGDGQSAGGKITTADGSHMRDLLAADGYRCGPNIGGPDRCESFTVYGLVTQLRTAGVLGDKRIPGTYLRASEKQRRALLAGLLDTDGTVCAHGRVQFDGTREALARDVFELVTSLGYRATLRSKVARLYGRECGRVWRVSFTTADPLFRLPRKVAAHDARSGAHQPRRTGMRYIVDVRPVESTPVRCITVDSPSSLYLAGRTMIPTHNTAAAIALVNRLRARRVMIVAPNRVRPVWPREVRERSVVGWHIEDGTRAAMRRGAKRQNLPHPERLARAQFLWNDCECGAAVHAFVLNYEGMLHTAWQEWVPDQPLDLIVYDEAHRLKSPDMKPKRSGTKVGRHERALGPEATDSQRREARRRDGIGKAEQALLDAALGEDGTGTPPSQREIVKARTADRLDRRAAEDAAAKRLTISGLASRWVDLSQRRVALTGTPFPQHPWDIFGLYRALDPGVFGLVFEPFRKKYVQMNKTGQFPVRISEAMLPEFAAKATSLMYRPAVDLQLPPLTDVERSIELEPEARKVYDEFDAELFADLRAFIAGAADQVPGADVESGVSSSYSGKTSLSERNLLTRLLRLQQLTGGTLRTDDSTAANGRRIRGAEVRISTAKADQLATFDGKAMTGGDLYDVGCVPGRTDAKGEPIAPEPVIVFCLFKSDLDAVKAVAAKAKLRYGEISGRRGDGLDANARMNPDVDVCAVQIAAGGTGVDLTRSCTAIWYSLGYSVSDHDQAKARLHRPGQRRPVTNIHYVVDESRDVAVYQAIRMRKAAVSAVLRAGGVDPAEVGLTDSDPGPDPNAAAGGDVDTTRAAVPLPWENDDTGGR